MPKASLPKIKVAVVGAGKMGGYHANVYSQLSEVELVGLVTKSGVNHSTNPNVAEVPAYTSLQELMKYSEVDAVSIASPTNTHKDLCIDALSRGCHVLLEKPISDTVNNANEVLRAAKRYKKKLMVGHIERFNPIVVKTKELLVSGKFGDVKLYSAVRAGPKPPQPSTNVLMDLGIHDIDLFLHLVQVKNAKKDTNYAVLTKRKPDTTFSDIGVLTYAGKNVTFVLETDWLRSSPQRETRIVCERGELHLDFLTKSLRYKMIDGHDWEMVEVKTDVNQLELEIKAFLNSVSTNAPVAVTAEEALAALEFYENSIQGLKSSKPFF